MEAMQSSVSAGIDPDAPFVSLLPLPHAFEGAQSGASDEAFTRACSELWQLAVRHVPADFRRGVDAQRDRLLDTSIPVEARVDALVALCGMASYGAGEGARWTEARRTAVDFLFAT